MKPREPIPVGRRAPDAGGAAATAAAVTPAPAPSAGERVIELLGAVPPWRAAVAGGLVLLTAVACWLVGAPDSATEAGVIMNLPHDAGEYWGIDAKIGANERAMLPPDTEFARKKYASVTGPELLCSIVLAGATKSSIHRPEVCLPAQGVSIKGHRMMRIRLGDGRSVPVCVLETEHLLATRDGGTARVPSLALYWFVARDTMTASHYRRHLITARDRILANRNQRWAYVLVTPTHPERMPGGRGFDMENGMPLLEDFVRKIAPTFLKPEVFGRAWTEASRNARRERNGERL